MSAFIQYIPLKNEYECPHFTNKELFQGVKGS